MSVNQSRNQTNLYQGYTNYQINQYNSNLSMSINLNNTQRLPISVNTLSSINKSYNNISKSILISIQLILPKRITLKKNLTFAYTKSYID